MDVDARTMLRAGPAFAATFVVAAAIGRPFGHMPSPEAVERRLEQQRMRMLIGTWLESLAAFLLMVFSAGLASRLREAEGDGGPLPSMALAGGVGTSVLLLGRAAATAAAVERTGAEGARPETATFAIDLGNLMIGKMAPMTLAAMIGAAAIAGHRHRLFPRWCVWASGALTATLLSPVNFLFLVSGLMWAAVVGWLLGQERADG